jgi:hypothetical protein
MTSDKRPAPSLTDDLHQAKALLAPICGTSGRTAPLVLLLLAAIWLAVERLRQAVQASKSADAWQSSEAATLAKGRELGIDPRPGERMPDYRARIAEALKAQGRA